MMFLKQCGTSLWVCSRDSPMNVFVSMGPWMLTYGLFVLERDRGRIKSKFFHRKMFACKSVAPS